MFPSVNEQMDIIKAGTVDLLPEEELAKKIEISKKKNKPLTIKLGADPSRPDLHIGHAVVLHKMREFQDLGHKAVLIIGDFTAMIGDPSGKSKTRPQLTMEETRINGQSYLEQATIILSEDRLEVKYNSDWLNKMDFREVIELASKYTVAQLLERDDFEKRYKSQTPISIHELLYPLAQAKDSEAINSDVELGGTDQKFNLLVGREVQRAYGAEPQCILTMPILVGTDGVQKMSKSLDNYISLQDTPKEMFGKIMSIPDDLIPDYMQYAAWEDHDKIAKVRQGLQDGSSHPRQAKVDLAKKVIEIYHDKESGEKALAEFEKIFKQKDVPDEIELMEFDVPEAGIMDLIAIGKLAPSKKEAKRLVQQGGVSVDGEKVGDFRDKIDITEERTLKVGKRKFLKVVKK